MEIKNKDEIVKVSISPYNPRKALENVGYIQLFKGKHKDYLENKEMQNFEDFNEFIKKNTDVCALYILEDEDGEIYCDEDEIEANAIGVIYATDEDLREIYGSYDKLEIIDVLFDEIDLYNQYLKKETLRIDFSIHADEDVIASGSIFSEDNDIRKTLLLTEEFRMREEIINDIVKQYNKQINEM